MFYNIGPWGQCYNTFFFDKRYLRKRPHNSKFICIACDLKDWKICIEIATLGNLKLCMMCILENVSEIQFLYRIDLFSLQFFFTKSIQITEIKKTYSIIWTEFQF